MIYGDKAIQNHHKEIYSIERTKIISRHKAPSALEQSKPPDLGVAGFLQSRALEETLQELQVLCVLGVPMFYQCYSFLSN